MTGAMETNKPRIRRAGWWGRGPRRCSKVRTGPQGLLVKQNHRGLPWGGVSQPRQGRGPGQVGAQASVCPIEGWPEADRSPLLAPALSRLALCSEPTKWLSPRRYQSPTKKVEWSSHSSKWYIRAHNPKAKPRSQSRFKATEQRSASRAERLGGCHQGQHHSSSLQVLQLQQKLAFSVHQMHT